MLHYPHPVQLDKSFAGDNEEVTIRGFLDPADKIPGHHTLELIATEPIKT